MKTCAASKPTPRSWAFSTFLLGAIAVGFAMRPAAADGQTVYVANYDSNEISVYDLVGALDSSHLTDQTGQAIVTSGTVGNYRVVLGQPLPDGTHAVLIVNSPQGTITSSDGTTNNTLVSGLSNPNGVAVGGANVYVANNNNPGTIGEYNATTGATVNSSLITGLNFPCDLLVVGTNLFVVSLGSDTIGEYDATTGAPVNSALITDPRAPYSIAVSGSNLYLSDTSTNSVSEYTTAGALVNASFITGLQGPRGLAVVGPDLLVVNTSTNSVGAYDATTGAAINANLITTGLDSPVGIAVAVPEPATWALLAGGLALLAACRRRMRSHS